MGEGWLTLPSFKSSESTFSVMNSCEIDILYCLDGIRFQQSMIVDHSVAVMLGLCIMAHYKSIHVLFRSLESQYVNHKMEVSGGGGSQRVARKQKLAGGRRRKDLRNGFLWRFDGHGLPTASHKEDLRAVTCLWTGEMAHSARNPSSFH
ncbi:hypothetical protein RvY_07122-1 [Ramazzottius varieornatus]|uniref:Uncharacterized protein n=1 Tax=Ramazzottius varieornatus TaxID=947166 RepID=A0A1D1V0Z8_RAMVA|nr:hypothetical protein RvY_07122-1 [Ramazzottius varieornatus]